MHKRLSYALLLMTIGFLIYRLLIIDRVYWQGLSCNPLVIFRDNFFVVEPDICYRCKTLPRATLEKYIKQYGIKTIINLRESDLHAQWYRDELSLVKDYGLNFYTVTLNARCMPTRDQLAQILTIIHSAEKPFLIHCRAGADRTGLVAALWVIERMNGSLEQALRQQSIWYGHIQSLYPNMRLFTQRWYHLKQIHDNDWRLALAAYDPEMNSAVIN